jgi:hypothetical protein
MWSYVDPDKLVAVRAAGASAAEIHHCAYSGEFSPAQPVDPRILM